MKTVYIQVSVEDKAFTAGWADKTEELTASIEATLFELQGDDGMAYRPVVTIPDPGSIVERRQVAADIRARITAEVELHQCAEAELPQNNRMFVHGLRRAAEVAAGAEAAQPKVPSL